MAINLFGPAAQQLFSYRGRGSGGAAPSPAKTQQLENLLETPAPETQQEAMRRQFSGMFGGDGRAARFAVPEEILKQKIDTRSAEGLAQIANLYEKFGDTTKAINYKVLAARQADAEAKSKAENDARTQLIQQAQDLGLEAIASNLEGGGDLKDAVIEINKEQIEKRKGLEGRAGRRRLAATFNAPAQIMEGVNSGAYDDLSAPEFMDILSGAEAETKSFTNKDGKQVTYREAADGKVFDYANKQWVDPNELGLTPSISQSRVTNVDNINAFTKGAYENAFTNWSDLQAAANGAVDALDRNATVTAIVNAGMNTGTFANWETGFTAALVDSGLIDADSDAAKTANNMRTYVAQKGKDVADAITAFGAGTGLSDADRKFAEKMVGADPSQFTEENIRKLLALEKIYAYKAIQKYNADVDKVVDRGLLRIAEGDSAESFKVSVPSGGFQMVTYEPTPGYPANNIYQISPGEYVSRAGDPLDEQATNADGQTVLLIKKTPDGRNQVFNTVTQQIELYN